MKVAEKSFHFRLNTVCFENDYFEPIGNLDWYEEGK